jgi:hypothetical protein
LRRLRRIDWEGLESSEHPEDSEDYMGSEE